MATFTLYDSYEFDINDGYGWQVSSANASSIILTDSTHQKSINFTGEFSISGSSANGTISGMSLAQNGYTVLSIADLNLDAATAQGKFLADNQIFKAWLLAGDDTFIINTKAKGGTMNGYGGNDTIVFAAPQGDYTETINSIGPTFNPTAGPTSSGQLRMENMAQVVSIENIEFVKFSDATISINGGNTATGTTGQSGTATFLQDHFNISMDSARTWVIGHLNSPQLIHDVSASAGVTSAMMAEIVQPSFSNITITGAIVNQWFASQGIAGLA